jgi:hypothetical protein
MQLAPGQQGWFCEPQVVPESANVPPLHPVLVQLEPAGHGPMHTQAEAFQQAPRAVHADCVAGSQVPPGEHAAPPPPLQMKPPEQGMPGWMQPPVLSQQPGHVAPLHVPTALEHGAPMVPVHMPPPAHAEPLSTHPPYGPQHPPGQFDPLQFPPTEPLLPPPPASPPWPTVASGMSVVLSGAAPDELPVEPSNEPPPEDPAPEPEEPPPVCPGSYGRRSAGCTTTDVHPTLSLQVMSDEHCLPTQLCARKMSSSRTRSVGTWTCATVETTGLPPRVAVTVTRAVGLEAEAAAMVKFVGRGSREVRYGVSTHVRQEPLDVCCSTRSLNPS